MTSVSAFNAANYSPATDRHQMGKQDAATKSGTQVGAENRTSDVSVTLSTEAKTVASSSSSSDFSTVASNARATLDAGYKGSDIKPSNATHVDEWREVMGGLDRRALYAIASNEGGKFSQDEQDAARTFMNEQQSQIFKNASFGGMDGLAGTKAVIQFLDNVSAEEKSSLIWAKDRAVNEVNYEIMSGRNGKKDDSLESDNPFVKMIKQALYRLHELQDSTKKVEDMPEYADAEAAHRAGESRFLDKKI